MRGRARCCLTKTTKTDPTHEQYWVALLPALKVRFFAALLALLFAGVSTAQPLKPEVETFIKLMAERHQFDASELRQVFHKVRPQPSVVKSTTAPATSKPWSDFRAIMLTPERIHGGVKFWNEHAESLARARAVYGVPEEIILAILGVETRYGRLMGGYRVMDALYTNAFEMNLRAEFFRGELEQFLLLARDNGYDPLAIKGSFAGAMGMPQFIPTSYRKHAVDFDGDGKINLWENADDAIGSVGSYLRDFGWNVDGLIVVSAQVQTGNLAGLLEKGLKPNTSIAELRALGVEPAQDLPAQLTAGLVAYESGGASEYWLSLNNFWVITRYNRSKNYAMSVYQLAREIALEREKVKWEPSVQHAE